MVRAVCDYHAPARFDDELEVCVRTVQIGRSIRIPTVALERLAEPGPAPAVASLRLIDAG